MANPTVGIDLELRLEKFKSDMASLPTIASKEGKAMAAQLSKELRAVEKAAQLAARASKDAAAGAADFGNRAGKAGQNASKLAGALGLISPGAAEAARSVADLADVGEVAADATKALGVSSISLTAVLGPVAVAVALLAAAYLYLSNDTEKANEQVAESARLATEAQAASERLGKLRRSAADAELVATGQATEADLALRDSIAEVTAEYGPRIEAVRAQLAEQEALAASSAAVVASGKGVGAEIQRASDTQQTAAATAARLRAELDGLTQQQGALLQSTARGNILGRENVKVKNEQAKAAKEDKDALSAEAQFEQEVFLLREKLANEKADKDRALRQEFNDGLIEQQAIDKQMAAERVATAKRVAQAQIDLARQVAEEQRAQDTAQLQSTADLFGSIASIAATARESIAEDDKDAQAAAFAVQQAAAIAQATVNAALAVSEASTLPYPANIVATAAAVGQGIANVAAVAAVPAPSFNDTPGVQTTGQRRTVSVGADDHFVAARDPLEMKRQVDQFVGSDPHADYRNGGPTVSIVGPRAFGRRMRDDVRFRLSLARQVYASQGRAAGQAGRRS